MYFGIVEAVHGAPDSKVYGLALTRVAQEAGALDKIAVDKEVTLKSTIGERLMMGLQSNSNAWVAFLAIYTRARK